jgi:hypothetical protein
MSAAAIAVSLLMLLLASPAGASTSCMSKAEARQHFASAHIYWHGAKHCWNATPTARQHQVRTARKQTDQPKWREAMSELLPDRQQVAQMSVPNTWTDRWVDIAASPPSQTAIDIPQIKSPPAESQSKPMLTPQAMLLVLVALAIALMLATIEFLFRRTMLE